jgi:hypothetical protein
LITKKKRSFFFFFFFSYLDLWVQAHGNNLDSETAKSIREELQEKLWNLERLMNPQGDYLVGDQLTLGMEI